MKPISRRDFIKSGGSAAALALTGFSCGSAKSPVSRKPNVLFIITDQHRGDCIGCDGNSVIRTPNIDRLASEGVRFSSAYSSLPSCTPARSSMMTGMSAWHHGMLGYGRVAERYPVELPGTMRENGYQTIGIGKMHWFPQRNLHGFHKTILDESGRVETEGFESDYRAWFRKNAPDGMEYNCTGIGWNDYRAKTYVPPEELHPTYWTAQTAVSYINSYNHTEPFFLKVSFARPHSPYDPPKRFMEAYSEDDMPAPYVGDWTEKFAKRSSDKPGIWHGNLGVEQAKRSRRGYYGSVSFIDEQIGRVLQALEDKGELDNTLILFTSDHGDMLGDHHHWRKTYAYEASARIPFIVRPPAGTFDTKGLVLDNPVEHRDIFPTFLDAAGQSTPEHMDGKSVLELLRGNTGNWREFIDMEHDVCYGPSNHWNALTDGHHKYIYHAQNGDEQLFNLKEDPGELYDISAEPNNRGKVREWRARMVEHLSERGEPFVVNGGLATRPERMLYSPNFPKS